jgi:hypothetical protein
MAQEDLLKSSLRLRKHHLAHLIREVRFLQQDAQEQGLERAQEFNALIDRLAREYQYADQRAHAVTYVGRRSSR